MAFPDAFTAERQDVECFGVSHGELVLLRDVGSRQAVTYKDSPGSAPFVGRHRRPEIPGRSV